MATLPFAPLVPQVAAQAVPQGRRDDELTAPPVGNTAVPALTAAMPPAPPGVPTAPVTPVAPVNKAVAQSPVLQDAVIEGEFQKPAPTALKVDTADELTKKYDLMTSRGTSTLQQVLSWVAAAKGDFRPLVSIEESKRKTALGRAMIPEMLKVRQLADEGNFEGAIKQMDALSTSFGARATEMLPYFQQVATDLGKKYDNFKNLQSVATAYSDIPNDHPLASFRDKLNTAVQHRQYISENTLTQLMTRMAPHVQILDGQIITSNPINGKFKAEALPQIAKVPDDMISNELTSAARLKSPADLANVLNGKDVVDADNTLIKAGSDKAWQIIGAHSKLLADRAKLQAAPNVPISPDQALEALKTNSARDVALRNFGAARVQTGVMERDIERQVTIAREQMEQDPTYLDKSGFIVANVDPNSDQFLTQQGPMTMPDVKKGNYKAIKKDAWDTVVRPNLDAVRALGALDTLTTEMKEPDSLMSRGSAYVNRVLTQYTKGILPAEATTLVAARAVVGRALNDLVTSGSANPNDTDIRDLRNAITSGTADVDQLKRGAAFLKGRADDRIKQETGRSIFDDSGQLADALRPQGQQQSGTGQQSPGQQQTSQQTDMPPPPVAKTLNALSSQYKVDPILTLAIASQESGGRHVDEKGNVKTSSKGAKGTMQLMQATADKHKVDRNDEQQNLRGGVLEIADLQTLSKNPKDILAGYVGGEKGMRLYQQGKAGKDITDYVDQTYARYQRLMGQQPEVKAVDKVIPAPPGQSTQAPPPAATAQPVPTPVTPAPVGTVPSTSAAPVTPQQPAPVTPGIIPGTLRGRGK